MHRSTWRSGPDAGTCSTSSSNGAEISRASTLYTVLETYNADLYERFWASGYDLTERHVMASVLGHSTSNRPLLGFVKRHRTEDPRIQRELNIALGDHAREGNERGVALCLWAGADPHAPALSPNLGIAEDADSEDDEEPFLGWSAIDGSCTRRASRHPEATWARSRP